MKYSPLGNAQYESWQQSCLWEGEGQERRPPSSSPLLFPLSHPQAFCGGEEDWPGSVQRGVQSQERAGREDRGPQEDTGRCSYTSYIGPPPHLGVTATIWHSMYPRSQALPATKAVRRPGNEAILDTRSYIALLGDPHMHICEILGEILKSIDRPLKQYSLLRRGMTVCPLSPSSDI